MPIKKNLLISLFIAFIFIFTIVLYNQNQVKEINTFDNNFLGEWEQVFADTPCDGSSHNIEGWAYANPIGPISLSCTNQNAPVNYGVNIIENFSSQVECSGNITCEAYTPPNYTGSTNYHHVRIVGNNNGAGSGTFTVPHGLSMLDVTVVGGGAAGYKWGGAGGYVKTEKNYKVIQDESINVVVGAGGIFDFNSNPSNIRIGKGSSFGSVLVNDTREEIRNSSNGQFIMSNGGSGGGGYTQTPTQGGRGGSNGSDGIDCIYPGGTGQHLTTIGIDGNMYAAGGGGGGALAAAAYGGVDSFESNIKGRAATNRGATGGTPNPNTGSGGGAGFYYNGQWSNGGNGASGVIIVRFPKLNAKELSGYAWSSAIGPISFNKNEICASGFCTDAEFPASNTSTKHVAKIEYVKSGVAKITGWARALGACDFDGKKCTTNGAGSDAGGWDGWIKFDGSAITSSTAEPYFIKEGNKYNTVIKTVSGEHLILGNAWGGDLLDTRTPPSAVLGEIRYIDAKTTYNPNSACAGAKPVASFKLGCLNDEVSSSNTCYFNVGSPITLLNESSDLDEGSPCYIPNDIKTSTWSPVGGTVSGRDNSSFIPTDTASYTQNISLTVEDYQGLTSDPFNGSWTLKRAIQANFSCCIKNVDGGSDCSENGHFKNCGSGFTHLTVTEDTKLYLRDNISLTTQHTIPASGLSVASRSWTYPQGAVSGSGENINIPIKQGGIITLTATDASGDDTEPKELDIMFKKINKNPDFKEIPFD